MQNIRLRQIKIITPKGINLTEKQVETGRNEQKRMDILFVKTFECPDCTNHVGVALEKHNGFLHKVI